MQKIALISFLALVVVALPAPADRPSCDETNTYKVTKQNDFDDEPRLVTGFRCTSNADDVCSLAQTATYTKGVTKTVNGGGGFTLELSKILSAGLDAGFSYSWSTSDAKGSSATVNCPKGGVTCGLQATTKMVHTEGEVHHVKIGLTCPKVDETYKYSIDAPKTVSGVPANQAVTMDFRACLEKCEGKQCSSPDVTGLPPCPQG